MADRIPLKQRDPNDPTVGLAAFESTDTLAVEHGGTGADTAAGARTNIDVYSKAESDALPGGSGGQVDSVVAGDNVTVDATDPVNPEVSVAQALFDAKEDTFSKQTAFNKDFGAVTGTVTEGNDARLSDARPPTAHNHTESEVTDLDKYTQLEVDNKDTVLQGQVTDNANAITTKEPIISPKNSAFNKNFGSDAGDVCEGNDARLSDSRDPTAHSHAQSEVTDLETDLSNRAVWKGIWVNAFYAFNEWVRDDAWGAIVVNPAGTNDRAGPQPVGDPFNAYTGTIVNDQLLAKQVLFGNRYTFTSDGYLNSYRINTVAGNHYNIIIVVDPLGSPVAQQILSFDADTTGWIVKGISQTIVKAGTAFDLIVQVNEPVAMPTVWTGDWDYQTPNNVSAPTAGEIVHADKASDTLSISYTDNASGDRTAELQALVPGDIITAMGSSWSIQSSSNEAGYISFVVTPATQAAGGGVETFSFETVTATPISYGKDLDYWLSSSYSVQGLFIADGAYADIVPDASAYGIDINVQSALISADWDLISYSGAGGGGSSDGGTAIEIVDDLVTQEATKALSANQGYVLDQAKASHEDLDYKRDKIAGIVGRGNSWLDFDFVTGELTLIPKAGNPDFTVWSYNEKYTKTNESIIVPTLVPEYLVYYDDAGELATVDSSIPVSTAILENGAYVARVSVNTADAEYNVVQDLRYDVNMSQTTRNTFILLNGAMYSYGLALENISADGSGDVATDAQLSVEDGQILLADIVYETDSRQQVLTFPAQIPIVYKIGSVWKIKAADDYPMVYEGSVGADYAGTLLPYNAIDPVTGDGTLLSVTNNDYMCVHLFATTGLYDGIVGVQGQFQYTSRTAARAGALEEVASLLISKFVKRFYTPIATVILQTGTGRSN
ncbi:MAG: hypothetical protein DRQ39_02195, partial [Gammaproteobacteria bacterium]